MESKTIYETEFWTVSLTTDQAYLGRSVIWLRRECASLSEVSSEEWLDFHQNIVKKLESAYKKVFSATMFNWTCLMNHAYKKNPPKPLVHWHFRPRYNKDVTFAGELFQDLEFAHHYDRKREKIVSPEIIQKISESLKKYL